MKEELVIDGMKNSHVLVILGSLKRETQVGSWRMLPLLSLQIGCFLVSIDWSGKY